MLSLMGKTNSFHPLSFSPNSSQTPCSVSKYMPSIPKLKKIKLCRKQNNSYFRSESAPTDHQTECYYYYYYYSKQTWFQAKLGGSIVTTQDGRAAGTSSKGDEPPACRITQPEQTVLGAGKP